MTSLQLTQTVLSLPEEERLELARKIVASLVLEKEAAGRVAEGIRRIEEVAAGKINGLTEQQFREALR
jgi:hypothetical protein